MGECKNMFTDYISESLEQFDDRSTECITQTRTEQTSEKSTQCSQIIQMTRRLFECNECGRQYFAARSILRHLILHTGKGKFQCDKCHKRFHCTLDLADHKRTHISKRVKNWICDVCGRKCCNMISFARHTLIHEKQYRLICSVCGKIFYYQSHFERHQLVHSVKIFECCFCKKKFREKECLERHILDHDEKDWKHNNSFVSLSRISTDLTRSYAQEGSECVDCGTQSNSSKVKHDEIYGDQSTYVNSKRITLPLKGKGSKFTDDCILSTHNLTHREETLRECEKAQEICTEEKQFIRYNSAEEDMKAFVDYNQNSEEKSPTLNIMQQLDIKAASDDIQVISFDNGITHTKTKEGFVIKKNCSKRIKEIHTSENSGHKKESERKNCTLISTVQKQSKSRLLKDVELYASDLCKTSSCTRYQLISTAEDEVESDFENDVELYCSDLIKQESRTSNQLIKVNHSISKKHKCDIEANFSEMETQPHYKPAQKFKVTKNKPKRGLGTELGNKSNGIPEAPDNDLTEGKGNRLITEIPSENFKDQTSYHNFGNKEIKYPAPQNTGTTIATNTLQSLETKENEKFVNNFIANHSRTIYEVANGKQCMRKRTTKQNDKGKRNTLQAFKINLQANYKKKSLEKKYKSQSTPRQTSKKTNSTSCLSGKLEASATLPSSKLGNTSSPSVIGIPRRIFTCDICFKGFTKNRDLRHHIMIHNGKKPYECPRCGNKFTRNYSLKKHRETCNLASSTLSPGQKNSHAKQSNHRESKSPTSQNSSPAKQSSYKSLKLSSVGQNCSSAKQSSHKALEYCHSGGLGSQQHELNPNKQANKKIKKTCRYGCDICDREFSKKQWLIKHRNTHIPSTELKDINCDGNNNLEQKRSHKIHRTPEGKSYYKCDICFKSFYKIGNLIRHQLVHRDMKSLGMGKVENISKE